MTKHGPPELVNVGIRDGIRGGRARNEMLQVVVDQAGLKTAHLGLVAGKVSCEVDFVLLQVLDVGLERQDVLVSILINSIEHGVELTVVVHFSFKNLVALFKVGDVV